MRCIYIYIIQDRWFASIYIWRNVILRCSYYSHTPAYLYARDSIEEATTNLPCNGERKVETKREEGEWEGGWCRRAIPEKQQSYPAHVIAIYGWNSCQESREKAEDTSIRGRDRYIYILYVRAEFLVGLLFELRLFRFIYEQTLGVYLLLIAWAAAGTTR